MKSVQPNLRCHDPFFLKLTPMGRAERNPTIGRRKPSAVSNQQESRSGDRSYKNSSQESEDGSPVQFGHAKGRESEFPPTEE